MPITAPKPENNYTLAPKGTHIARVFKILNLGTHDYEYQGQPKVGKFIRIYWELPNKIDKFSYTDKVTGQQVDVEKPFAISREFTLSMSSKSNLRAFVEGIIGVTLKDEEAYNFDFESLLGKECLITISHVTSNDRTFAKATGTAELMEGQVCPPAVNPPVVIDVNTLTEEECGKLPDWLREKFTESAEWKKRFAPKGVVETAQALEPDEIPF